MGRRLLPQKSVESVATRLPTDATVTVSTMISKITDLQSTEPMKAALG